MRALYLADPVREALPEAIRPGGMALTERLLELVPVAGLRVFDAGCGTGISLTRLQEAGATGLGLDPWPPLVREAKKRGLTTLCARMEELPLAASCCELVLTECAWNLSNRQRTLDEFRRVLVEGGLVAISDIFSRSGDKAQWPLSCCFTQAAPLDEVRQLVEAAGFTVEHLEDHTQLLKQTAAEFVFRHGSLQGFWESITGNPAKAAQACAAGRTALPGLFLLVARKKGELHG